MKIFLIAGLTSLIISGAQASFTAEINGGAVVSGETVDGEQEVINGTANSMIIVDDGEQYVYSGGIANDTVIENGGAQIVFGKIGGTTSVNTGGLQILWENDFDFVDAMSKVVIDGGAQVIGWEDDHDDPVNPISITSDQAAKIQMNHGLQEISNGSSITGMTIKGVSEDITGQQSVRSGATAADTIVGAYGRQFVDAGGETSGTVINGDGAQIVMNGGRAEASVIGDDGVQSVRSGSVAKDTVINSGGEQDVWGTLEGDTYVKGDGVQFLLSGSAIADSSRIIIEGGLQAIGAENDTPKPLIDSAMAGRIDMQHGTQVVNDGASIDGMTIKGTGASQTGKQEVKTGATATNTTIGNFGTQEVRIGASVSGTTVNTGGKQQVLSGATATGTIVNTGGTATIYRGGVISGATVNSGGALELSGTLSLVGGSISDYSTTANNTNLSGGTINMAGNSWNDDGSVANNTTITAGGTMNVGLSSSLRNATANNTTITNGTQNVYGYLDGTTRIEVSGKQNLRGALFASSGANIIIDGGLQTIVSGSLSGSRVTFNSGTQTVNSGATVSGMTVASTTSALQNVSGTASNTTIGQNGKQIVSSTGTANSSVVNNGGVMDVSGTASNAKVNSGGTLNFKSGSTMSGTNNFVYNGGIMNIESGATIGSASAYAAVMGGGTQTVDVGATANYMRISGIQDVSGTAGNTTINSGGIQNVSGTAENTTVNNGGTQNFKTGSAMSGTDNHVNAGGIMNIESGAIIGSMSDYAVIAGIQNVDGTAKNMRISGGTQNVFGTAENTDVGNGGAQIFKSGSALAGSANWIGSGGSMIFESASFTGAGAMATFDGGRMTLRGFNDFTADFAVTGNGIIDVRLHSTDSDHYTFGDIEGTFGINLTYSQADAVALNALGSIDIIQNNSADKTLATFSTLGHGLDIGKYNWYIETDEATGVVSAVKTEKVSTLLSNAVNHAYSIKSVVEKLSNSMHKRVGELQWLDSMDQAASGGQRGSGVWARGIYRDASLSGGADAGLNISGAEFGYDFKAVNAESNKIYVGFMGYAAAGRSEYETANADKDKGDISAYGVGLYGIWLGKGGWFADAALRQHFISQDVTAYAAGSSSAIAFDTSHAATSLNLDVGREFVFGAGRRLSWFATPHVQFNGAYIAGYDFTMSNGQKGEADASFNAQASVGVLAGPRWNMAGGAKLQLYAKAGYIADFSDDTKLNFDGMDIEDQFHAGSYEFGGGLNYRGSGKRLSAYLDVLERVGDDYQELAGTLGVRYEF
ncbi:MAG: autotransporter outer membrane beta-barrel domain-containing protein [Rickettsiales bacterium]|jgi:outer membrane autotransporter protein|nr:autotransporter outer membrane beta-barrel domain-containing protein [Rickettsiales bacterium]